MITRGSTKCRRLLYYTPSLSKRRKYPVKNILYIVKPRYRRSHITKAASASTLSVYLTTSIIPYEWTCGMFGGLMLGSGASLMLAFHGRIAGLSGLLTKLFDSILSRGHPNKFATCSQLGFVAGLLASGVYWNNKNIHYCGGKGIQLPCVTHKTQPFEQVPYSPYILAVAGLLVGIGTRMGSGCTTGHGICGLARRSPRSFAAVATFFTISVVTTTAMNAYAPHLYKLDKEKVFTSIQLRKVSQYGVPLITGLIVCSAIYSGMRGFGNEKVVSLIPSILAGYIFGTGLVYSCMSKPSKIREFLDMNPKNFAQHWNPTLAAVMFGAVAVTSVSFPIMMRAMKQPLLSKMFHLPTNSYLDRRLLIGSSLFGLGWGLGGLCPGPGLIGLSSTEYGAPIYIWFLFFMLGNRLVVLL